MSECKFQRNRLQLNSFNHFRAIAIIFIVAGHSFWLAGLHFDTDIEKVIRNLIAGGTSLFVFISGFLFHHVFLKKYDFKRFFTNKVKSVLIPYIILGVISFLLVVLRHKGYYNDYFLPSGSSFYESYIVPTIKYYWRGHFQTPYWYIPFIMITFLLSPLHLYFISLRTKTQLGIILLLSIVSIFMHRPVRNIDVLQSVLYFTPVYLFGIVSSIHRNYIYNLFKGREVFLLILIIGLAVLEVMRGGVGNYHKHVFEYGSIDIMFIQKIVMCVFWMVWLNRFEKVNYKYIHTVASTSFAIFFLHPFLIEFIKSLNISMVKSDSWIVYVVTVFFILFLSILIAKITRKILPSYSKFIIGY